MTDPLSLPGATPRHQLPVLFAGQAQKEATVNAGQALIDLLLHPAVLGERADAPPDPSEGDCWLVSEPAAGTFAGYEGHLAGYQRGSWMFAAPRAGMRVHDLATGQTLLYVAGWQRLPAPPEPNGGAVIDTEARAAIVAILQLLGTSGIVARR